MLNYSTAPNNFGGAWQRYVEDGISPGSFGVALLENDLTATYQCADRVNLGLIKDHIAWLHNEMPYAAWGSPEKVIAWAKKGGMKGNV